MLRRISPLKPDVLGIQSFSPEVPATLSGATEPSGAVEVLIYLAGCRGPCVAVPYACQQRARAHLIGAHKDRDLAEAPVQNMIQYSIIQTNIT